MDDPDIREAIKRKERSQRAWRIALGLLFFGAGAFMSAAVIIGFDAPHAGWQDYLIFILPLPWLVVSGMVLAYRPKPNRHGAVAGYSGATKSSFSFFHLAIVTAVFGGFLELLRALNWSDVMHSLIVTTAAVLLLLLLSHIFKKAPSKPSSDAGNTVQ